MKKTILLFLLLIGFSTLQAQSPNTKTPISLLEAGVAPHKEGVNVQKNAAHAAMFASRTTVPDAPKRITRNISREYVNDGTSNIPDGIRRNVQSLDNQVRSLLNAHEPMVQVPVGSTVLEYRQSGFFGNPDLSTLLASIGFTVTSDTGSGNLNTLIPSQPWDLLVLQIPSFALSAAEVTAIGNYIAGGGKVIMDYWALNSDPVLQGIMGTSIASSISSPLPVFVWDAGHPIFNTPNAVGGLTLNGNDYLGDNGDRLEPIAGASAPGGFTPAPAANQAAIILGNGGNTIFHGFSLAEMNLPEVLALIENEAEFLLGAVGCTTLYDQATNGTAAENGYSIWDNGAGTNRSIMDDFNVPAGSDQILNEVSTVLINSNVTWSPPSDVEVTLRADAAGSPGAVLSSEVVSGANLIDNGNVGFPFGGFDAHSVTMVLAAPPTLTAGTTYWLEFQTGPSTNFFQEIRNTNAHVGGQLWIDYSDFGGLQPGINLFGATADIVMSVCTSTSLGLPPVISCPMDITVSNDPGVCGANVSFADAIALDPEDGQIPTTQTGGPASGDLFPVGDTDVTFSATDSDGNTSTCTFTVTVEDTEAPVVVCQDITVELDANGEYVILPNEVDGGSTDNCGIATYEFGVNSGTATPGLYAMYPWDGTDNLARYDYDPVTDNIALIDNPYGSTSLNTNYALDYNPADGLVYLLGDSPGNGTRSLFVYDLDNGVLGTEIGQVVSSNGATNPNTMAFGSDGTLYVTFGNGELNTFDIATQTSSAFATVSTAGGGAGLTFDYDSDRLIYTHNSTNIEVVEITTGGTVTPLFTFPIPGGCGTAQGLEYVGGGKLVAGTTFSCSEIYTIDLNTGNANSLLGSDGFQDNIKALLFVPGTIPVPSITFTCDDAGENNVTLIVTDVNGNVSTCSAVVTVEDNTDPEIVCIGEPATVVDSTSDSPGLAIVDNTTVSATMSVADDFVITDLDVDLDITHTWVGDLQITLESPAGTQVLIFDGNNDGCSGDNIVDRYDDESANVLDCQAGSSDAFPLTDYIPSNALSAFDGESTLGDWTIFIEDTAGGDQGTLNSWTLNYSHDVVSSPLVVELDANGMATIDASALLLSIDEACGYTVTTGGGAPIPGSLGTLFGSNNGGAQGGAVYFDVTVGPEDINVIDLDLNTADAGGFTVEVYSLVGTYVGNEGNAGAWTLSATGTGTGAGIDVPSNAVLDAPITLTAGTTYGMALVLDAGHGHSYTNGDGSNQNFSNADLSIQLGAASNVPFDGSPFSPRVWNGNINYEIGTGPSTTIEFDCSDLGFNEIEVTVTDDSGNTASCTATVEVVDVTDPILVCMDATVELDENGMAEVLPEYFIDEAASFDACGITITAVDVTDVTCDDIGTAITVTVFASDSSGNLASCTATMTVVDLLPPVIENCPEDQTVDPGPLNLFYELPDYWTTGTTATDNCTDPVTILSQDPPAGTLLPDGVYTITMTAEDEYQNVGTCTFELTIESILGIENNQLENGVVIYPNPSQGVMNIVNATSIQLESAAIYDMNGRLVQNINLSDMVTEKAVDVSNLASGVYMVQIIGEGGQTVKRLVKE
jgi:subtilisin-like proprotein convertase family protein